MYTYFGNKQAVKEVSEKGIIIIRRLEADSKK